VIEQNNQLKNKVLLPESVRQQYLKSMGIQTWFDPQLVLSKEQSILENNTLEENFQLENNLSSQATVVEINIPDNSSPNHNLENNLENINLKTLAENISQCELCELHTHRKQAVSGEGDVQAKIFIIIDAPILDSVDEYALLNAASKQMLQAMLQTIGLSLSAIFISSLVKCQPAGNRAPQTSEMICCDEHLSAQIKLIQPDVIMVLGEAAAQQLLVSQKSLTDLRLRDHKHLGVPVYASYHPADLFNSSQTKRKVWADLLHIKQYLK